jgi:hypothetical protein
MSRDILPYKSLVSGDMSGNLTSAVTNISNKKFVAAQCKYTGAPVGTLAFQASVDGVDYATVLTQAVNGADLTMFNAPLLIPGYVRVIYTFTSGTGSLNVTISAKE